MVYIDSLHHDNVHPKNSKKEMELLQFDKHSSKTPLFLHQNVRISRKHRKLCKRIHENKEKNKRLSNSFGFSVIK